MRKVTRNDINTNNMVAFSYCQCQMVLDLFASEYKVGYNAGVYGWNYDLYEINGVDIITGYRVPYKNFENKEVKRALIALENELRKTFDYSKYEDYKKRFLEIFK